MSNKKEEQVLWRSVTLVSVGLLLIFALPRILDVLGGLISFYAGFTLLLFGLADISIILYRNRKTGIPRKVMKQYRETRMKLVHYHRKQLHRANRGVVWIWIVALAGMCVYAVAFYVLLYPTLEIIGIVEGLTTFDADAAWTLNFTRVVLNWHPILFIVGLLIWAFVNSQRREDVTYPAY